MRPPVWTKETEKWLLNVAWKKMSLQQIAKEINAGVSVLSLFYRKHNIKPMTQRDFIASKLLDVWLAGEQIKVQPLSVEFGCSQITINSIIKEYGLEFEPARPGRPTDKRPTNGHLNVSKEKHDAIAVYDAKVAEINRRRASFTYYTQSGSILTDQVRGMRTTLRPETYLTNCG